MMSFDLFSADLPDPLPEDYPSLHACPEVHHMGEFSERFAITALTINLQKGFMLMETAPNASFLYRFVEYDEQRLRWLYLFETGTAAAGFDPRDYLTWRARLLRSAQIDMAGFYTSGFTDYTHCRTMRTQQRAFSMN